VGTTGRCSHLMVFRIMSSLTRGVKLCEVRAKGRRQGGSDRGRKHVENMADCGAFRHEECVLITNANSFMCDFRR